MRKKAKKKKGYGCTMKIDGSVCTLQHYMDGTSSFNIATLVIKNGKPFIENDYLEFELPKREDLDLYTSAFGSPNHD